MKYKKKIVNLKAMRDIYDITSTPEHVQLKDQILTKLRNNNKQGSIYESFIQNYTKLYEKYFTLCSTAEQSELNRNSIKIDETPMKNEISKSILLLKDQLAKKENNSIENSTLLNKALIDTIEMKKQIDRLEKENGRLYPENEVLKTKCASLEKRNNDLDDITQEQERTLFQLKQKNTKLETEINTLNGSVNKLLAENKVLLDKIYEMQNDLGNKMNQCNEISQQALKKKQAAEIYFNEKEKQFKSSQKFNDFDIPEFQVCVQEVKVPKFMLKTLKPHKSKITSISFNAFGTQFITSSADCYVKKWDANTSTESCVFTGFTSAVTGALFDNTEQYVFAGSMDKSAKLWSLKTKNLVQTFNGHMDFINCVKSFYSSSKGITGSSDLTIKQWDFNSLKLIRTYNCNGSCHSLGMGFDDSFFISGHKDGHVKFWSPNTDKAEKVVELHDEKIIDIVILSNQSQFLSISYDYSIKLFDFRQMKSIYTITETTIPQFCESNITLSSDKKYFAVGSGKGTVFVCDMLTGSVHETLETKSNGSVFSVQWRPHHSQIYVGDSLGNLFIWGLQ